jgi:hypothetical protein
MLWLTLVIVALFVAGALIAGAVSRGLHRHVMPKMTGRPDGGKSYDDHLPEYKTDKFVDA